MYRVGGESELCYGQIVFDIKINNYPFNSFQLYLGITKGTYGLNGSLGVDFMSESNIIMGFHETVVRKSN